MVIGPRLGGAPVPCGRFRCARCQPGFYETPGWQRAQRNRPQGTTAPPNRGPITIDGTLIASSTAEGAGLTVGLRVFHQKFGYGRILHVDGNKLTVDFDKAGEKKVVDSFVERV